MNSQLLNYYRNVLGIKSILLPEVANRPTITSQINKQKQLVFFIDGEKWSNEEFQLFNKMLAGIDLKIDAIELIFIQEFSQDQIKNILLKYGEMEAIVVTFDSKLLIEIELNFDNLKPFFLNSPAQLLKNPALKRIAWETLKKIKAEL